MLAAISQKVSEALRIWKEHFRRRNGRSISRQAAPSCTVTANNRIVISRAQRHRNRERWNRIYSDAPWLDERYSALGFEIKRRDDGVVVAGIVKSIGTARFVGTWRSKLEVIIKALLYESESRFVCEVILQDNISIQIV